MWTLTAFGAEAAVATPRRAEKSESAPARMMGGGRGMRGVVHTPAPLRHIYTRIAGRTEIPRFPCLGALTLFDAGCAGRGESRGIQTQNEANCEGGEVM
jgi:hypothetical protein